jgi:hypothetical protein
MLRTPLNNSSQYTKYDLVLSEPYLIRYDFIDSFISSSLARIRPPTFGRALCSQGLRGGHSHIEAKK